jgi:hypothetical protein
MYRYQAASTQATALSQFSSPPSITNPAGVAAQASVVPTAAAPTASTLASLGDGSLVTAAVGVGVSMGNLTGPPAVVGPLPASQTPVQLASAVSPLPAGESGLPTLPPPISAGSGWRKRKPQKYEDVAMGLKLKGTVMPRPPSVG